MSKFLILLTIASLPATIVAEDTNSDPQDDLRIISGYEAESLSVAPHQVSLRYKRINFHFCGGSIINNFWILSAAHCFTRNQANETVAVVGTLTLDKGGDRYNIEKVVVHKHYMPSIIRNDIAMLKVEKEFSTNANYKPIALADTRTPGGVHVRVTGWGMTRLDAGASNKLMALDTKSISNEECIVRLFGLFLPPISIKSSICTGNKIGTGSCMGDSGGPLVDVEKNTLVGIVSWGYPCAWYRMPDMYTRVDSYLGWINDTMAAN